MTNAQVCHIWAQGNTESGRTGNGNLFFEGDTIYSYGYHFWIAHRVKGVMLVNCASYSPTTSQHQSDVRQAIYGTDFIRVPYKDILPDAIKKNFNYFKGSIANLVLKASRAREYKEHYLRELDGLIKDANRYSKAMGRTRKFSAPDVGRLLAKYKKVRTKELKAAKIRKAERIAQEARDLEAYAAKLLEWEKDLEKRHVPNKPYRYDVVIPIGMRLKADGETIETSQGAEFPMEHARRAYPIVKHAHDKGESMAFAPGVGSGIKLGHFQINSIDKDGNVKAGCHYVTWDAIERLAKRLNF